MKKIAIFLLFLLANMVLLAHAVLPHHHHDEVTVCYVATHCEDAEDTQEHHHTSGHHHDDRTECVIKYDYARISNEKTSEILNQYGSLYFLPILLFERNVIAEITNLESLYFEFKPYLFHSYKDFITRSLGLRAPPVC